MLERFSYLLGIFLLCVLTCSCPNQKRLRDYKGSYLESIKLNFHAGEQSLKDEKFEKAINYFQFVKTKYPFSKYAALSDLRIADTKFAQKKWLDAATVYEIFMRLRPRHEQVEYALFRMGLSYFKARPSKFFIFPPPATRDQRATKEALSALERFILRFPKSEYVQEAKSKRLVLYSDLARHHQHVASYYQKRGQHEAAISRLLEIQNLYPDTPESTQALFLAGKILEEDLQEYEKATQIYQIIISKNPDKKLIKNAQKKLKKLKHKEKIRE